MNANLKEGKKLARLDVSSNYPMQYLSPASTQKQVSRLSKERKNLQIKIDALKPYECDLNDKQHSELLRVVTAISKDSCAVEQLCSETNMFLEGKTTWYGGRM